MRVNILDHCIRCGMCVDLCPEYFTFDLAGDRIRVKNDGLLEVEAMGKIKEMAADCAVAAIQVKE